MDADNQKPQEVQDKPIVQNETQVVQGEVVTEPVSVEVKQEGNRDAFGKFVPGKSGNPNGRPPREWSWSDMFAKKAEEIKQTKFGGKKEWREIVVDRLFIEAANGNIRAIELVIDRMDGKVAQTVNLGGMQLPQPITDALTKALTPTDNVPNNDGNKETK